MRRECHHAFAPDDPMPLIKGLLWPRLTGRLATLRKTGPAHR
jgi:hypothetical protein